MAKMTDDDPDAVRGVMTRVNQRGWKELKVLSVERGTTLNALTVEALNDLLKKYGKKAVVQNPLLN
jgi:predicted dinucleotide-binding enzyme